MTEPRHVPERPTLEGLESRWDGVWQQAGTYRFDRSADRADVFSIDTPPPTVSGTLHMGSVFGYVQTDAIARYHRMRGKAVFYPMGWDDNGLPTERRVENFYGVRCDPSLPFDPEFTPPAEPDAKRKVGCSRPSFVALCLELTAADEREFERLWRRCGLSVDWQLTYTTIGARAQRTSQQAFLHNLARGEAYASEAPTLWDVTFQTAVAQAELEDRELPGAYVRYAFRTPDGAGVSIETTRPELLPACVALVAHPDDERYQPLFGTTVTSPLFDVEVPVLAHELAQPDKGSGIAMICTFGDTTDVTWWRELDLPVRGVLARDGRLRTGTPGWIVTDGGRAAYAELAGRTVRQAQVRIVELLREAGELDGEPRPITHPVKFYERGDRPLEVVTSRQWYVRNGGREQELRAALLARGAALSWHPAWMRSRYDSWVQGLNGDWLISRQRFFGVPIPLWYPVRPDGSPDHAAPIVPAEATLPVDPSSDVPPGYTADQRGVAGGFIGDPDIMDTWATSSLTPQIACGWVDDPDLFARTFPMDLRPQGPEIIRTWLFSTVVRSHLEHDALPWTDTSINGWILDPDRKKMSKSKGNATTPTDFLERHGSDAVRYWATSARPGMDTALDEGQMKVGRRLAVKLLNASRFALGFPDAGPGEVTVAVDQALLLRLADVVEQATVAFDGYDYARALERTEAFFWLFCDDYIELVKTRAYGQGAPAASASRALRTTLETLLQLFAPFLPFATEEVWSWWQPGSVHTSRWPTAAALAGAAASSDAGSAAEASSGTGSDAMTDATTDSTTDSASGSTSGGTSDPLAAATLALHAVRAAKSAAKTSMRTPVLRLAVTGSAEALGQFAAVEHDVRRAGVVQHVETSTTAGALQVQVLELGEAPPKVARAS